MRRPPGLLRLRESMAASRQTFKKWRAGSLAIRLSSGSEAPDPPSAAPGAAGLVRHAGARERRLQTDRRVKAV